MKKNGKKLVVVLLVLMLVLGGTIGGTLAWLVANSNQVTNTFVVGNITLSLVESWNAKSDAALEDNDIWQGKLVPGMTHSKDPKVIVGANSEACWLFVKIEETGGNITVDETDYTFDSFITYAPNTTDWALLEESNGTAIYWMKVDADDADQPFNVLAGNATYADGYVTINNTVTKAMMDQITDANAPKLSFTAYAIQQDGLTDATGLIEGDDNAAAARAWALVNS